MKTNVSLGIMFSGTANLIFAIMIAIGTYTSGKVDILDTNFIQFGAALLTTIPYIIYKYGFIDKDKNVMENIYSFLRSNRYDILIFRAIVGCLCWLFIYLSAKTGITNNIITLLTLSATVFLPIISIAISKIDSLQKFTMSNDNHTYDMYTWGSIIIGLIGSFIYLYPTGNTTLKLPIVGIIYGLLSGVMFALAQLSVRWAEETENRDKILSYFFIVPTIIFGLLLLAKKKSLPTKLTVIGPIIITGVILVFAEISLNKSLEYADPSIISSTNNSLLLFSMIIGYILFKHKITKQQLLGSGIIIAGGLFPLLK